MSEADGAEESKRLEAAPRRRFVLPTGFGIAGLGAGYLAGRVIAVPGTTQLWDIAAQPIATALAGAGAIGAGYLAFHNGEKTRSQDAAHHQETVERDREGGLRERYTTAAAQLADDHPAIREAGTYAVAALADDWMRFGELTGQTDLAFSEMKVCVSLLCSYLRANRMEVLVAHDDRETKVFPHDERAVRDSVISVLRERAQQWQEQGSTWAGDDVGVRDIGVDLSMANLVGARFASAYLNHADLLSANLEGANLSQAKLVGADLTGTRLTRATLFAADLSEADMEWANLSLTNLIAARLPGAKLSFAKLPGARLRGALLADAWLEEVNLAGAKLENANLSGAHMQGANLADANLSGAKLDGTDLTGIRYDEGTVWPDGFSPPASSEERTGESAHRWTRAWADQNSVD